MRLTSWQGPLSIRYVLRKAQACTTKLCFLALNFWHAMWQNVSPSIRAVSGLLESALKADMYSPREYL